MRLKLILVLVALLFLVIPIFGQQTAEEWFYEGVDLYDLGKYDEAILAFEEAIRLDPELAEAWNNKGLALEVLGKTAEAYEAYTKSQDLTSNEGSSPTPTIAPSLSGEWVVKADFGEFVFLVDANNTISQLNITYDNFTCEGITRSGSKRITAQPGWPIINGTFSIESVTESSLGFLLRPEDLTGFRGTDQKQEKMIIQGEFDETGRQASGTWTEVQPYPGGNCSCNWEVQKWGNGPDDNRSDTLYELKHRADVNPQDALSPKGRVLFDETRPQPYDIGGVIVPDTAYNLIAEEAWWGSSDLATLLREDGFEVFSESARPLTADKLRGFDVLVVILSNDDYTSSETEVIYEFVQEGGGLFLVPNAWVGREIYSINCIARRFGLTFAANGALTDSTSNYQGMPRYVKIDDIYDHPITSGVESLGSEYGTYLKETDGAQVLARTSSNAKFEELVLNGVPMLKQGKDAVKSLGSYPVLAVLQSGQGRVVFFSGFVLDNDHLVTGDNRIFSLNTVRWLAGHKIDTAGSVPLYLGTDATITPAPAPTQTVLSEPRPISSDRSASTSDSAKVSRPVTGTYIKPLVEKGYGEILINNGLTKDAVVVMTKSSGATLFSVYVRAGERFRVEGITDGTYRLFFTSGDGWDYAKKEFGRSQEYYLMEGPMPFTTRTTSKETVYTIYEVTLHLVSDGNVDRLPLNKAGFPKLA